MTNLPMPPVHHVQMNQNKPKVGVLLVNLGTPNGTDYWNMRTYLKQFLSDPRVIEVNRFLWWLILNGIILSTRPQKSGQAYQKIWDQQKNASPLRVITESQQLKLQQKLGPNICVAHAMRYGTPSIADGLNELKSQNCHKILVAPLYPQYAGATTATVMDDVAKWLLKQRYQPSIRQLPPYYDQQCYIEALAASLRQHMGSNGLKGVIIASFHGLPLQYCQKGDVYYCHSHKTARLLAEKLGIPFCKTVQQALAIENDAPRLLLTFQSRFGKQEWLQPYTDKSLEALGEASKNQPFGPVTVICPGFAADCVETLEEIAIGGMETFHEAGGHTFTTVPCLNDSDTGMDMLEKLVQNELKGWV